MKSLILIKNILLFICVFVLKCNLFSSYLSSLNNINILLLYCTVGRSFSLWARPRNDVSADVVTTDWLLAQPFEIHQPEQGTTERILPLFQVVSLCTLSSLQHSICTTKNVFLYLFSSYIPWKLWRIICNDLSRVYSV